MPCEPVAPVAPVAPCAAIRLQNAGLVSGAFPVLPPCTLTQAEPANETASFTAYVVPAPQAFFQLRLVPVAPVAPVDPIGPGTPLPPAAPVRPVPPVAPVAPVGPAGPARIISNEGSWLVVT